MKIIGLTGGIGSGKSTVARVFKELGVPVYNADKAGHRVLGRKEVQQQIIEEFGSEVAKTDGSIDRAALAKVVFDNEEKLQKLNSIIHPRVSDDFDSWLKENSNTPYVLREAAITVETGLYKKNDLNIMVTCPERIRIDRVVNRDKVTEADVRKRMAKQWPDEKKRSYIDKELVNDGETLIVPVILDWHKQWMQ